MPSRTARPQRRLPWKWVGLAGLVGVVATGAAIARAERRRAAYTPEQVRVRLHSRHAEATRHAEADGAGEDQPRR